MNTPPELHVKFITATDHDNETFPLVIGPSLGTSVDTLWRRAIPFLEKSFTLISWDLPGHGLTKPTTQAFHISDLAVSLLNKLDVLGVEQFYYAGSSIGGAVGLELARLAPNRVKKFSILCSAVKFGEPTAWVERAKSVRQLGTPHLVTNTVSRWFAPGFLDRDPDIAGRILNNLRDTDNESYALAAEALATYDFTDQVSEITTPLLAIAGEEDPVCTPLSMKRIAETVRDGTFLSIPGASHQAIAERPAEISAALLQFFQ